MKPIKTAVVILKGATPSKELLEEFWHEADCRVCADGAAEVLVHYQLEPDIVLGDLDSLPIEIRSRFLSASIVRMPDQNSTDGEKAFQYCIDNEFQRIQVFGALGNRTDHGLYNLGLLKRFHQEGVDIVFYTKEDKIRLITSKQTFFESPGTRISLIPIFGTVENAVSEGLVYPLRVDRLTLGRLSSISNEFRGNFASVDFSSGELLVVIERKRKL